MPRGSSRLRTRNKAILAFWNNVYMPHGDSNVCWEWTACTDRDGYGSFYWGRRMGAHRFAWIFSDHGEIPIGLNVCHKCDNPLCCNPSHLFLGTSSDNNRDMTLKGRNSHQRGSQRPQSKLTEDQAREIFLTYNGTGLGTFVAKYGVSEAVICGIKNRKKWKHATKDL